MPQRATTEKLFKRVLAIGPHPDDIELGCFGALARFKRSGSEVRFLVATCGGGKGLEAKRRAEAEASATLLDAKVIFGDLPDTAIPEGNPTIGVIENAIKAFKPTAVFVNSQNDTHQDHRNVARAAISASRLVPTVLFYQTPSSTRYFNPQVFVEIDIALKMRAVRLHKSQGKSVYMAHEAVRGLAEFLGLQIYQGGTCFEGFEVHQMIF